MPVPQLRPIVSSMSLITSLIETLGDARGSDPAGALLSVLIAHRGEEFSVADAGRAGGVSKATAARTVDRLVECELVTERRLPRERMISINTDSPVYPAVAELLWVARGVHRSAWPVHAESYVREDSPYYIGDLRVQQLVPAELQTRNPLEMMNLPGEVYDGPELIAARALVSRLVAGGGVRYWNGLQQTYARWGDERDRDLIHLTLHLGWGAQQAINVLRADTNARAAATRAASGRKTWAHAVYAVDAEAHMCLRLSEFLAEAVNRARRLKKAQREVAESVTWLQRIQEGQEPRKPLATMVTNKVTEHEAELEEAKLAMDGYYRHGGTPRMDSVDCAGERLMVVQLRAAAAKMSTLAHEMAAHPSFLQWQRDNPHVHDQRPLLPVVSPEL